MKKSRVISPVLFAVLSVVCVFPALSPTLAVADAPAKAPTSSEEFLCNLSQSYAVELDASAPNSNPAVETCGYCSQNGCVNMDVGSFCSDPLNPGWGWCLSPWGSYCASTSGPVCQCMAGGDV